MASGGMGAAQQLLAYQAVAEAQGLPEGHVVRIDSRSAGAEAQITLASIDTGALPAGTFDAPNGYQTMQMPFPAPGARD